MAETRTLKASAIIADLTNYLDQCKNFEAANIVVEKHVSTQITVVRNPAAMMPGQPREITTVLLSILYITDVTKQAIKIN